jgi:hypothetical protein
MVPTPAPNGPKTPPPLSDDDVTALREIVEGEGLPRVLARRAIKAWQAMASVPGAVNALDVLKQTPPQLYKVIKTGQWSAMATVLERMLQTMPDNGDAEAKQQKLELVRMAAEDSRASAVVVQTHYAQLSEHRREEVAQATGRAINIRPVDGRNLTNAPDVAGRLAALAAPKTTKR